MNENYEMVKNFGGARVQWFILKINGSLTVSVNIQVNNVCSIRLCQIAIHLNRKSHLELVFGNLSALLRILNTYFPQTLIIQLLNDAQFE